MGYPILGDGSLDYDQPAPTPQHLTDPAQGYGEPSDAAMAFAEKVQRACFLDVNLYDLLQDDVARLLDAFAAQAVEAALNHAQYIHMMESDDKADKAAAAEKARLRAKAQGHLDKCKQNAETAAEDEAAEWEDNAYSWQRFITVMFDEP